jgi:hypothetical protein
MKSKEEESSLERQVIAVDQMRRRRGNGEARLIVKSMYLRKEQRS